VHPPHGRVRPTRRQGPQPCIRRPRRLRARRAWLHADEARSPARLRPVDLRTGALNDPPLHSAPSDAPFPRAACGVHGSGAPAPSGAPSSRAFGALRPGNATHRVSSSGVGAGVPRFATPL
jgi:hypothetical protein